MKVLIFHSTAHRTADLDMISEQGMSGQTQEVCRRDVAEYLGLSRTDEMSSAVGESCDCVRAS